jgi:hypothetical protein
MATKKTARGRKQDRARVAGGQNYELASTTLAESFCVEVLHG